jgi:hypothetical protein
MDIMLLALIIMEDIIATDIVHMIQTIDLHTFDISLKNTITSVSLLLLDLQQGNEFILQNTAMKITHIRMVI